MWWETKWCENWKMWLLQCAVVNCVRILYLCTMHRVPCTNLNFESIKIAASISIWMRRGASNEFHLIFHVIYHIPVGAVDEINYSAHSVQCTVHSRDIMVKEIKWKWKWNRLDWIGWGHMEERRIECLMCIH